MWRTNRRTNHEEEFYSYPIDRVSADFICLRRTAGIGRYGIGYVDGDTDYRIRELKGCLPEEWLVSRMPMDGGAMLLKEENVVNIPYGLTAEY